MSIEASTETRRSIDIEGLSHLTEIPVATRVGPMVVSSVIAPFDPGSRKVPADSSAQLENIFTHVGAMLDAAGAAWGDVAKMDFWAPNAEMRAEIDSLWVRFFPDARSRPSRHTHIGGKAFTATFMAYVAGQTTPSTPGDDR